MRDERAPVLFLVLLAIVGLLVIAWGVGREETTGAAAVDVVQLESATGAPGQETEDAEPVEPPSAGDGQGPVALPGGGSKVFAGNRFLVAYYGTGQTPALGVLGESPPDAMDRRLHRAAAPFRAPGRPLRHVYELIATVADGSAGRDRDYSHDIPREVVETYIRAAHRNDALLLLDLQPGRTGFPAVARRWAWALRDPWVGLALDAEWRMGPHQVPAHASGQVSAAEVNRTSAFLARLAREEGLPEKLFVLHQFRADMITHIDQVRRRPGLATVQHVDGFGTRAQKRATYHAVAKPARFTMGLKLFYDEDVRRMGPREVRALRPKVRFVSFQ